MRIKSLPDDFRVEERLSLPLSDGPYAYYRVEERGVSTTAVRDAMADRLKVTPSALVFPAFRDATAIAVQYASVRKRGPERLEGPGFVARRVGWGGRALAPHDVETNDFVVVARDLSEAEAAALPGVLDRLATYGLPNYFDDQRFGSLTADGFIGKAILQRDAEKVIHMYLAEPMLGDSAEVREFKALAVQNWGQWGFLLHQAPRPSNLRSVITFLKDHPHDYIKAVNLIQDRLLSIYLSAYQSWVWNRMVAFYCDAQGASRYALEIAGTRFPLPEPDELHAQLSQVAVELPRLTAMYEGLWEAAAAAAFEAEALALKDFKARILRRVYLSKGDRPVWFMPLSVAAGQHEPDTQHAGRRQVQISFVLDSSRYATLVIKAAAALLGTELRVR